MSKDVDRKQVLQTTRVRTALKNDGSWIHKPKDEQDAARTQRAVETTPGPVKPKSYVLSAAKKFDVSAKKINGETPSKVQGENVEAQQQELFANSTAENKEERAVTPLGQSNVECKKAKASEEGHVEDPVAGEADNKHTAEVPAQLTAEPQSKYVPSIIREPGKATNEEKSTAQHAKESCEIFPSKQVAAETVAEVAGESSHENPTINNATPGEKIVPHHSVEAVNDTISKSPTQSAATTAAKSAESKTKFAAPAEPVLRNTTEEVVEIAHTVENTVANQSTEPVPVNEAEFVRELSVKDAPASAAALEPAPVAPASGASPAAHAQHGLSDAQASGAAPESYRVIELTDALDVAPPTVEATPNPVNDPKQSHPETSKVNQSDDTNNTKKFQKPRDELRPTYTLKKTRDGKAVCSYCDQVITGNVKIRVSEPLMTCHEYCLKCGVCAKALGDLVTPIFLHDQVIHCDGCFQKALRA